MRNETMFAVLMRMASEGRYGATVEARTVRLAEKYGFSAEDLLALKTAQETATGGASTEA